MKKKERAAEIFDRLSKRYPAPKPALDYTNPWELLVATALSAQCTDERVNKVTPVFFERWPEIKDAADADVAEIEDVVRSTGFFRNKAKNIKAAAQRIMSEYQWRGASDHGRTDHARRRGSQDREHRPGQRLRRERGHRRGHAREAVGFPHGIDDQNRARTGPKRTSCRCFRRKPGATSTTCWSSSAARVCPARKPKCDVCELNDICPKKGVK